MYRSIIGLLSLLILMVSCAPEDMVYTNDKMVIYYKERLNSQESPGYRYQYRVQSKYKWTLYTYDGSFAVGDTLYITNVKPE